MCQKMIFGDKQKFKHIRGIVSLIMKKRIIPRKMDRMRFVIDEVLWYRVSLDETEACA